MKRWQVETSANKTYFVYAPTSEEASALVVMATSSGSTVVREVGSFENGFLTIPQEEARMIQASVQHGEVKFGKGKGKGR